MPFQEHKKLDELILVLTTTHIGSVVAEQESDVSVDFADVFMGPNILLHILSQEAT